MYSAITTVPVLADIGSTTCPAVATGRLVVGVVTSASALPKNTGRAWSENTASAYVHCTSYCLCAVHVNNSFRQYDIYQ